MYWLLNLDSNCLNRLISGNCKNYRTQSDWYKLIKFSLKAFLNNLFVDYFCSLNLVQKKIIRKKQFHRIKKYPPERKNNSSPEAVRTRDLRDTILVCACYCVAPLILSTSMKTANLPSYILGIHYIFVILRRCSVRELIIKNTRQTKVKWA